MGTYKVPQNVEADDKILGPLSLKQFVYAMIGVGYGLLTFAILKPLSIVLWVILGLPPMLALLGLGLYQREDQPMETFVIAIIEFFVQPRKRLWQKEPIAEVFRLEPPPPKPEEVVRDPRQVRSQLAQLADLVDTRGWSAKQPELQEPNQAPVVDLQDRLGAEGLTAPTSFVAATPEVTEDDDILSNESVAAKGLNVLIENTVKSVREEVLENMKARGATGQTGGVAATGAPAPAASARGSLAPQTSPAAGAAGRGKTAPAPAAPSTSGSTAAPSGDILKLAAEGGDLTVAQIAAQARRYHTTLAEGESVSLRHAEAS
jgi:PrgI family protein